MKLNLTATTNINKVILNYLENNVTEELANKINNGVEIEKNGIKLINKKTLDGFINYATNEAKKLAEKNATSAVVQDDIVYGWAIHYFEEDSIEENLYNLDGTKYEEPKPVRQEKVKTAKPVEEVRAKTKQERAGQLSFFDILDNNVTEEPQEETVTEEIKTEVITTPEKKIRPVYEKYLELKNKYKNCIVLKRLGDFYEAFGDDATQIANKIDLTLTGRDFGLEKRVPMVGFPYHAADVYFAKLTEYFTLVIEEQEEIIIKEKINKQQEKRQRTIFEQYKELKDAYPDFIIALKVGNYYEVYGNDAQELANEIGYLLTERDSVLRIRCYETVKNSWINKISQTHNIAFGSETDDLEFYTRKQ